MPGVLLGTGSEPGSVLGQPEYALAQDVAQNFRRPGPDAAGPGQQLVELPLTLVGRPLRAVGDLRVGTDDLGGDLGQLLIDLAPEQLRGRALGAGSAATQDVGEAPVTVEGQGLLADPEAGHLLTDDGVIAPPALAHQPHEPVQRVAERDVPDEREEI